MIVDVYVVNEKVATINCQDFKKHGRSRECKNTVPPCKFIPAEFFKKYGIQLQNHQAYGFLCYAKKGV